MNSCSSVGMSMTDSATFGGFISGRGYSKFLIHIQRITSMNIRQKVLVIRYLCNYFTFNVGEEATFITHIQKATLEPVVHRGPDVSAFQLTRILILITYFHNICLSMPLTLKSPILLLRWGYSLIWSLICLVHRFNSSWVLRLLLSVRTIN